MFCVLRRDGFGCFGNFLVCCGASLGEGKPEIKVQDTPDNMPPTDVLCLSGARTSLDARAIIEWGHEHSVQYQVSPYWMPNAMRYPPPPCRSLGGGGDRHLVNPKIFVETHCVVVWVTVLWGTATCIPCTHGRTFCSLSLKWNLIAQPCVPLGQV